MVIACVPCRKRKCKCDGSRPICLQCNLRVQKCTYEKVDDKRRRSHKEFDAISNSLNSCIEVIKTISQGGVKSFEIVEKLQADPDFIKNLISNKEASKSPLDTVDIKRKLLQRDDQGGKYLYGETSNVPMIGSNEQLVSQMKRRSVQPNNYYDIAILTHTSQERILELLSLYFCWQHSYFSIFDKELFLRDMHCNGPFYSEFLLCCILSHSLHLSVKIEYLFDNDEVLRFGDVFYERAIFMLVEELENPSITTVQGLLLLASKESGIGKNSLGWIHSGTAFRIALALGLHLNTSDLKKSEILSEEEIRVRKATFWGCYIFDQGWSLYLGRPYAINDSEISLPFPDYIDEKPTKWSPFYELIDTSESKFSIYYQPKNTSTAVIKLYLILKEIITSLYSPKSYMKKGMNYRELLENYYKKVLEWQLELPTALKLSEEMMHPASLMLHTMYYSAIIFLFRPFFKLGGEDWKSELLPDPLVIGVDSAKSIMGLLVRYKTLFKLTNIVNLATYVTSTASTVYVAMHSFGKSPDLTDLILCQDILYELSSSWPDAKTIHQRIKGWITSNFEQGLCHVTTSDQHIEWDLNSIPDLESIFFGNDVYLDWEAFTSQ